MDGGTNIRIGLTDPQRLSVTQLSADTRDTMELLAPYMKNGKLSLWRVTPPKGQPLENFPRMFSLDPTAPVFWYTDTPEAVVIDAPLPGRIFELSPKQGALIVADLEAMVNSWECLETNLFGTFGNALRWDLRPGQIREFGTYFAPLAGAKIRSITLRDPFCMQERNRSSTITFLKKVRSNLDDFNQITIEYLEPRQAARASRPEPDSVQREELRKLMKEAGMSDPLTVKFRSRTKGHGADFHDRFVTFDLGERKAIYDLSGGLDRPDGPIV
jgi:hypothetical protein